MYFSQQTDPESTFKDSLMPSCIHLGNNKPQGNQNL